MAYLVGMLDRLIAATRPEALYLPFPSMHQDHLAGYEAGVRAGRLSMSNGHWFTPSLYVYDVSAYDVTIYPSELKWNLFESLNEEHIDKKVAALSEYSSQAVTGPHPINSIKEHAQATGNARQLPWGEPYAVIRQVCA
jgi:LmbE family N-acetylglucosaminyl deacetylase